MRLRNRMRLLIFGCSLPAAWMAGAPARAQPFQGLYVGAGIGYHATQDIKGSVTPASSLGTSALKLRVNGGFVGLASVGYGLGNGFRFEIEGSDRLNNLGHLSGTPFPTSATGSLQTYAVMVNALFDLDVGSPWIYPYFGGGVGYGWTALDRLGATSSNSILGFSSSATKGGFAYQGIAGLSFPIPNVPGLSMSAEYRLFGQPESRNLSGSAVVPGGRTVPANLHIGSTFDNAGLIGIRYAFNVQPPPPTVTSQPVPAPSAAQTYLVFFDWDRAVLTDRARQIVHDAAEASQHAANVRIEVNGNTDTSGTPTYNRELSLRRARVVAAELVKDGVAREAIAIQGFGDTHLLVPTAAGVREPRNRRVEIMIK